MDKSLRMNDRMRIPSGHVYESTPRDYLTLKPRVMTGCVYRCVRDGVGPQFQRSASVPVSHCDIMLAIGAGGGCHHRYDRDIDAIMNRTKTDPPLRGALHRPKG